MNLHDEIAKVAHELYEKSGRVPGRDLDNWLEAEKIVMARYEGQKAKGRRQKTEGNKKYAAKKTGAGRATGTKGKTKKTK
ncbi:hypothetical protein JZK55_20520 [Dissulfurispira thermophila]|uniref:DUF2934 domain-containing protein n=2 Tax=root TaxID=1 RepID=A0A7G1H2V9_9BACT|nr:DUF2934 domain-containing protein [Dissulfurispira thermophila]BCB97130.1 hypothetical protein JZK55_20520 [Dissulfurispira thermophila]